MKTTLLIITARPTEDNLMKVRDDIQQLLQHNGRLHIFFTQTGVEWLNEQLWNRIYYPDAIYYAHALDVEKTNVPFRSEVIFSSEKALQQLKQKVDFVYAFN